MFISSLQKIISMRIIVLLVISAFTLLSCRDGGPSESATSSRNNTSIGTDGSEGSDQSVFSSTQNSDQQITNASSEFHYVCVNNCEGSGANAAGTCPVCGEELVHNTSFHSGEQGDDNGELQIVGNDDNSFSSKIAPLGQESSPSPAPDVTGDASFHYICSAGCGGGGQAQGSCPSCGAALVHNNAFHANQGASSNPGAPTPPTSTQKYPSVFNSPNAVRSAPAQGSGSAFHYICTAGCGGGGNAQGNCPSCGALLAHNDAFHQ